MGSNKFYALCEIALELSGGDRPKAWNVGIHPWMALWLPRAILIHAWLATLRMEIFRVIHVL